MSNRLSTQTSLYLRQHAENRVDWYSWGPEAFDTAKEQDRPIFLSIGYSACHWCHVMAHESFEDANVADLLNDGFVSIKVDREEHPEVDQVYQRALQLLTDQAGGWPLSLFLLPTGEPFYGGTYFPPTDRFGKPAFSSLLKAVKEAYQEQKTDIQSQAQRISAALTKSYETDPLPSTTPSLQDHWIVKPAQRIQERMDPQHGGFLGAPKFPNVSAFSLLLRAFARTNQPDFLTPLFLTLEKMASGGIFDQLGGGFARYAVDEAWRIPHFEKMLSDNAMLLQLYTQAYQAALQTDQTEQAAFFAQVVQKTVDWLKRDMQAPGGGFYAAQDADSEGQEGAYYVWSFQEIHQICSKEAASVFCRCYGVTEKGNWQDPHQSTSTNILYRAETPRNDRERMLLDQACQALLSVRSTRIPPNTDRKILTSWNGLLLSALSAAAFVFQNKEYLTMAQDLGRFLLVQQPLVRDRQPQASLPPATLDDYAFLTDGLFQLAHASAELHWLDEAYKFTEQSILRFYHSETNSFFVADRLQSIPNLLPAQPVSLYDQAVPSGAGVSILNLLRLAALLPSADGERYTAIAQHFLSAQIESADRYPSALGTLCAAIDLWQYGVPVVTLVSLQDPQSFKTALQNQYIPDLCLFLTKPDLLTENSLWSMHAQKKSIFAEKITAYVCTSAQCHPPVTTSSQMMTLLSKQNTQQKPLISR